MKSFIFRSAFLIMILSSFAFVQPVKAQSAGEVVTALKQVYDGASYVSRNWTKISWFFHGMKHTWWACVYQDGFTTYNNPRSYRNANVVLNYFTGNDGDCDAFYYQNGAQVHLCYNSTFFAQKYASQHGPITDLLYQDSQNSWHSVLNTR